MSGLEPATKPEKHLYGILVALGLSVEPEKEFPPYRVDCYVPELHVAFEADGPFHARRKDERRDSELLERYGLIVHRVSFKQLDRTWKRVNVRNAIADLALVWSDSVEERKSGAVDA